MSDANGNVIVVTLISDHAGFPEEVRNGDFDKTAHCIWTMMLCVHVVKMNDVEHYIHPRHKLSSVACRRQAETVHLTCPADTTAIRCVCITGDQWTIATVHEPIQLNSSLLLSIVVTLTAI